jgi:predicted MFS family arabinose efflux permease
LLGKVFKAFQYRDFRLMWIGSCTSSIGTWMQIVAQSWLVYKISGSPFFLGLDAFLGQIPIMLLSLVGGVFADRRDRRKLLLMSQYIQMGCAFFLALLVATGMLKSVYPILGLSTIVGFAQAFGGPAYQALVPTLVKSDDLSNAIALNSIQFNLARVIGPMLGGIALEQLGAGWCFSLNGLSFLAVILTLYMVKARFTPASSKETVMESMRQGIGFIRQRESMVSLIVLAFAMTMLGVPALQFLPVFAKDVFHAGPRAFTIMLSSSGAGSVAGALVVAALARKRGLGRAAVIMLALFGATMASFALSTSFVLSCVFLFFSGASLVAVFAMVSSLVQLIVTDEMRGRVMSVYNVAFRGGMPVGSLAAGALIPIFSAPHVIATNGGLLIVMALYLLFMQRRIAAL